MANEDQGMTSTGIKSNVAGLLCYSLGWVTGLIFFLIEKDNKFVRFHAIQSMVVFGGLTVLNIMLSAIFGMLSVYSMFYFIIQIVGLAAIVLWILLMVKAYQGEMFKLPVAGDIAEQK